VTASGAPIVSNVQLTDEQKEELKGEQGFSIVASVNRPSFTEAQWTTYGTTGHEENWTDTSSIRNGCRVGDLFTITGTATDTKNAHVLCYKSTTDSGDLKGKCLYHSIAERGEPGAASTVAGPAGRSVGSTTKYYKLTADAPSDITSSYTEENPPTG
jgi:hypothetical protein